MSSSEANLEKLKNDTGIDFPGLRDKYKNMSTEQTASLQEHANRERNKAAMAKLDNYSVCKRCNGQGTITEVYNHFNMEKNCPECDGDCIFLNAAIPDLTKTA
jgi:DnaJ-class molecular chaperone